MGSALKILNLGCGSRYDSSHTNVDFVASGSNVFVWNLQRGIPFPAESFDVVYHSHVLEHFDRKQGEAFLAECNRVLKHSGVLRVAVPDLEGIATSYLDALSRSRLNEGGACADHDWMVLELCDQMVRTRSGGEMRSHLASVALQNRSFVMKRLGWQAAEIWTEPKTRPQSGSYVMRLGLNALARKGYVKIALFVASAVARVLLGRRGSDSLREGWFRSSGEIHRHMFDELSLKRALTQAGFSRVERCEFNSSRIPGWERFYLDADSSGRAFKPDSLFVEGERL